ncbi:EsaB/YukD family protein [Streptomyces zagrosensis]|uniref:Type VII secretion integral membrane protein EccD n=1 Tax=Streptomyces zagrosensis TaxID=1042984 RepID=A0A7W9Q7F1_9ACTN|nr:EsaB/YukD family protein [Streptomyces zagrosensis]MBB5933922.1 type VII secretion integral membrane protein EccD [Streptomyces zagrosensis]
MVSSAQRRAGLSRVTLVGERRRIDMLLPADEPVGELLPDILEMMGSRPTHKPMLRRLVLANGAVLAQDDTLESLNVPDGAVIRLVREQETPAAPVVHDVTDEAAEDLDVRGWRWNERARVWTAGAAHLVLALVAAGYARDWLGADRTGVPIVVTALVAAAMGAPVARWANHMLGTVLILLGGVLGVFGAWTVTAASGVAETRLAAVGLAVTGTLALLGLCTPAGRGGLVGAGAVALATGGWELGWMLTDGYRVGVAVGTVSVLALGFLPRLALMSAGLTRLDDQRSGGASVSRHGVDVALSATHRGLVLATVTAAGSAAVGGWLALERADAWTVTVVVLLAVVLLSRARAFPLGLEVVALQGAAVVLAVRLVVLWSDRGTTYPLIALAGAAVVPLVVLAVRPPDHVRVRLRRLANLVESVGVVVLIPAAIGAFGVYDRLLNTF